MRFDRQINMIFKSQRGIYTFASNFFFVNRTLKKKKDLC